MKNPASLLGGGWRGSFFNFGTAHEAEEPPAPILWQRMTLANNLRLRFANLRPLGFSAWIPIESATHNNIRQSAGFAHCRSI
jgi:hypothetical protein